VVILGDFVAADDGGRLGRPSALTNESALIYCMLVAPSALRKKLLSRPLVSLYSQMSQVHIGVSKGLQQGSERKPVVIPFSSRLREGRALAQDVWTIFKYVPVTFVRFTLLDML
jgi:hypothetical protein